MPRQSDLFPRSKSPTIPVATSHRLVQIADTLDWDQLQRRAQQIRRAKLKNAAGRPPHLRATLGAMMLMGTRKLTYREAEDLIQLGAYASGTNPKLDAAIRMRPELLRFLQQDARAESRWDETLAGLRQLASQMP